MTVVEAAAILGVTPDAVRSRLRRGTLTKEVGEDGTVYVRFDGDGRDGRNGQATSQSTDRPTVGYIDALGSENELLRRELEAWQEEARRKDHIIMNMTEALRALNPPAPPEARNGHETPPDDAEGADGRAAGGADGRDAEGADGRAAEGADRRPANIGTQEGTQRRSWWRRWFGFEH